MKLHNCWLFRLEKISEVEGISFKISKLHCIYLKQVLVHVSQEQAAEFDYENKTKQKKRKFLSFRM
jgi:hypothetical protein